MAVAQQVSHVLPLGSRVNERGRLEVGGCDLVELAREVGTPAYVVAEDDLRARARAFKEAFAAQAGDVEVHFAAKAFPCTAVLALFAQEGLSCDVAGGGELAAALRAGFAPGRIHVHGNAKTEDELRQAIDAGVGHIVLDNADEVDRLERLLPAGAAQPVQMRIAPGVSPDTHPAISTGGPNTKFGFNVGEAPGAIARVRASDRFVLEGLHIHIGSQILDLAPFEPALRAIAGLGDFDVVNLGGGLGVAYREEDRPPSVDAYAAEKVRLVRELLGRDGRMPRVLDEPGRALVGNGCVTLYGVQSVKRNVATWVGVDGGMADNLRPMLYGARYEAMLADRPGEEGDPVHLTGRHCESGDVIVRDARLPAPRVGDVVVTPATGAYGFAMANNYNGARRPPVVFVKDGDARVVVRRETYDDLFARDVADGR
jgi:diaminopimelate decarboxylase